MLIDVSRQEHCTSVWDILNNPRHPVAQLTRFFVLREKCKITRNSIAFSTVQKTDFVRDRLNFLSNIWNGQSYTLKCSNRFFRILIWLKVFMRKTLTLTRTIGLPPHTLVAQKSADQRWLIVNSVKNRYLFIYNDVIKGWLVWINIVFFFSSISFVRISY